MEALEWRWRCDLEAHGGTWWESWPGAAESSGAAEAPAVEFRSHLAGLRTQTLLYRMVTELFSLHQVITETRHTDIVKSKIRAFVRQTAPLSLVFPKGRGSPDKVMGTDLGDLTTTPVKIVCLGEQIQRCSRFRG